MAQLGSTRKRNSTGAYWPDNPVIVSPNDHERLYPYVGLGARVIGQVVGCMGQIGTVIRKKMVAGTLSAGIPLDGNPFTCAPI